MIGKTRRVAAVAAASAGAGGAGKARGVLRAAATGGQFAHVRLLPAADIAALVEHFWLVRWDLAGQPAQRRETLPHPNVHWVFEQGRSDIFGPHSARFTRSLEGRGGVFGIKFRAGGFYPFLRSPVAAIADRALAPAVLFGDTAQALEQAVHAGTEAVVMADAASRFLRERWPATDPSVAVAANLVATIAADRSVTRVADLVERYAIDTRALQRLFRSYVGVSPKWVINRYRLHEAIEQLDSGAVVAWADLAQALGYFDQAHFIRDFRRLVGQTPQRYRKAAASAAPLAP